VGNEAVRRAGRAQAAVALQLSAATQKVIDLALRTTAISSTSPEKEAVNRSF
jgi:hypothetical protein